MRLSLCFLILFTFSKTVSAQVLDSIHYGWEVFEIEDQIEGELEPVKRCYVMTKPKTSQTSYTGDRDAYIAVSRFEDQRMEEVSISSGYEYKIGSKIYVLIGGDGFNFFTKDDSAWLDNSIQDKNFIEKMLKNDSIKVRSDSAFGAYAIDEYSLKGFARAYKRMKQLCT